MSHIGFVLFHTGETRALLPSMERLSILKHKLSIIPVGLSAKNCLPKNLERHIKIPNLIKQNLGLNDEFDMFFNPRIVKDITDKLKDCDIVIFGSPAKIQQQIAKEICSTKQVIVYFDLQVTHKKAAAFGKFADKFILTTDYAKQAAISYLNKNSNTKPLEILLARHGDFDFWLQQHHTNMQNLNEIYEKLQVHNSSKVILWAGGYDDFSDNDIEERGFLKFLKSYKLFKSKFDLRIAVHPGLKSYNTNKLKRILNKYYIINLLEHGFSPDEIDKVITNLETNTIASIARATVSVSSTVGPQSIFIGTPAKNVYINNSYLINGVESVKSSARWKELLTKWVLDNKKQIPKSEYNNLGIPQNSTIDIILKIISK